MYQLQNNSIKRLIDNAIIPLDELNLDYQKYLEWLNAGNIPQPEFTEHELFQRKVKSYEQAVQAHLDGTAQTRGYDSIISACSYGATANHFQAEGQAFIVWRSECWRVCFQILQEVQAGTRTEPTIEELIAELPIFNY
jgi:hypothetical protein